MGSLVGREGLEFAVGGWEWVLRETAEFSLAKIREAAACRGLMLLPWQKRGFAPADGQFFL